MWVLVLALVGYGSNDNQWIEGLGEGALDSLPLWEQTSLLETNTCNTSIFESARQGISDCEPCLPCPYLEKEGQLSQDALAHWSLDLDCVG